MFAKLIAAVVLLAGCASVPVAPLHAEPSRAVSARCTPGHDEVAVFEHADFAGRCAVLGVGDRATPESIGLENDTASSALVGDSVRLLACRDRAFAGECAYLSGAVPRLEDTPVGNDALSSLRVEPAPANCTPGEGQIAVFADRDFGGACAVLGVGDFSHSGDLGVPNDAISSVRVGPGAQVLLCRDDEWGEPCERFTGDAASLVGHRVGNDEASSVRVLPGRSDCVVRGADESMAPHAPEIEAICAREYPRIGRLLGLEPVFEPPLVITFSRMPNFTGEALGREVLIEETRWDPRDLGMIDHELTHVVTLFANSPSWVTEGVADYVRSILGDPWGWGGGHCAAGETYLAGYGCAAELFRFVEARSPGAVRAMSQRLRTESFDGQIAGRPVDDWWAECREGPCRAR